MRKILTLCVLALIGVGCASTTGVNYRPIVDTQGVDLNRYEMDLRACQTYATQTSGAGESAAVGAVGGAVLTGLLAAAGGKNYDKGASARMGAVAGAAGGAASGETSQRNIIRRCLAGRGYKVLQ